MLVTTTASDTIATSAATELAWKTETLVLSSAAERDPSVLRTSSEGSDPIPQRGSYSGGSGTAADPYRLATKADLLELAASPTDYNKHFVLTADLDLAGEIFTTALIAPDTDAADDTFQGTAFTGTFVGAGHTIHNLTIDTGGVGYDHLALFGKLGPGAQIADLRVEDVLIVGGSGSNLVGGLCGHDDSGAISQCSVTGSISGCSYSSHLGGLCGRNSGGTISECHSTASLAIGNNSMYLGGLCGFNSEGTITECYATGPVAGSSSSFYLGGLCGFNSHGTITGCCATGPVTGGDSSKYLGGFCGNQSSGTITDCYATGAVTGGVASWFLGGLCGYTSAGTIAACYATGAVASGDSSLYLGGFCGYRAGGAINASFWDTQTSGMATSPGATGRTTAQMRTQSTFTAAGWDFVGETTNGTTDLWYMRGYPALRAVNPYTHVLVVENGTGDGNYEEGNVVTIVADAAPAGLGFAGWTCDPEQYVADLADATTATTTFTMPATAVTLTATYADLPYSGGSGTAADPYRIATKEDLLELAANNFDCGKHFVLTADIDLAGETFTTAVIARDTNNLAPGFQGASFTGVFDGRGHVVRNLTVSYEYPGRSCLGFFGGLGAGARVANLGVESVRITGGYDSDYLGGLCGVNDYGTIQSSYATGTVAGGEESDYVGGLCGSNHYGTVDRSYFTGTVTGGISPHAVGGLCGMNSAGTIGGCYATGSVTGGRSSYSVGGLCGASLSGTVSDCYATATVTVGTSSGALGGLCGRNDNGTIANCYAIGPIHDSANSSRIGGLCGNNAKGTVADCYFYLLGGPGNGLGTPLDAGQFQDAASFIGFDFAGNVGDGGEGIWSITDGHCPRLVWQEGEGPLPPTVPATSLMGSGTVADPFVIADAADFAEFCGNAALSGGYYSLTCDVDLAGEVFSTAPVKRMFGGVFEGNGHVVRNLTINVEGSTPGPCGLFASSCGTVSDLGVEDFQIAADGASDIGGFCGRNEGVIRRCYATGSIAMSRYLSFSLGVFCGRISGTVTDCYAAGSVLACGHSDYIGGFCGENDYGTITNCYAASAVAGGDGSLHVGGFCGGNYSGMIGACYFHLVGGPDNGLGIPVDAERFQEAASFSGFDFAGTAADGTAETWTVAVDHCPRLAWQEGEGLPPPSAPATALAGSGSATDPFVIADATDFAEFRSNMGLSSGHYLLLCDVDLADEIFAAAAVNRLFSGVFEGNGHVVRNLTIDTAGSATKYLGLFALVYGTIRDLGVENVRITAGTGSDRVGGLCGAVSGGTLSGCYATGLVTGRASLGGLCGDSTSGTIRQCYATTTVTGISGSSSLGGLCGTARSGTIADSYATGAVSGGNYVGGLCGSNSSATVSNCYARGRATETGGLGRVGGLCWYSDGTFSNCFWDVETSGQANSNGGGTGRTTAEMQTQATFTEAGWDFAGETANGTDDTWHMDGYPALRPATSTWYALVVGNGSGGGHYREGTVVMIVADAAPYDHEFAGWTATPAEYATAVVNPDDGATTLVMPAVNLILTATYSRIPYSGGSGTEADPYRIATKEDLLDLASRPEDYSKCFALTADLDLAGETFTTAVIAPDTGVSTTGFQGPSFTGVFDGGGHAIDNLTIDTGGVGNDHLGFFGKLGSGAQVTDLRVEDVRIVGGNGSELVGGLCGHNESGTIRGCSATGSITGGSSSKHLGGLCGRNSGGTISECHSTASLAISNNSMYLGGLCGLNSSGGITTCYATGSVAGSGSSFYLGGLCGFNSNTTIVECYATGPVTGGNSSKYLGGFCGYESSGTIAACYATGTVAGGDSSLYLGGFCGYRAGGAINASFWDTQTSGMATSLGGTGKTTAQMQTQATFTAAGWDFVGETANGTADIWYMRGYPALRVFATLPIQVLDVRNGSGAGSYEAGTIVTVTAETPPEGQEFAGWTVEPTEHAADLADATAATTTFVVPDADVTLTATYVVKTYTVVFDLGEHGTRTGGGELVQAVTHGTAAVAPELTVTDDWEFTGWSVSFASVTSDHAVSAQYAALDTDGDCLPDWWERLRFGDLAQLRADDPDGDGFSNWEEFLVGTDPNDNQSYPRDRAALVWEDAVHKLRIIGTAIEHYREDHGPDALPGRLMYLVDQGYLDADMLLAIGDESGGTDPCRYDSDYYAYLYEAGVSFFYEASESLCPWTVAGYPYTAESTWYDVKMYQLAHGRLASGFEAGDPYDRRAFPIIRFFWGVDYRKTGLNSTYRTSLNLAVDCRTVFASSLIWEKQSDVYLPDDPVALRPIPTPVVAQYGVPLNLPLWFAVKDVASLHGLRLVAPDGARDAGVIGEIRGHYYTLTPDIDTPTAFTVTVEWDDGTGTAQRASFAVALDSGPDDDPDGDGLSNAAELAAGTAPYDGESRLTVSFMEASATVPESAGGTIVRCRLSGVSALPVTVDYAVTGGTATGGGVDYTLASGTLLFAAGGTTQDIELTVIDDLLSESTETVQIELANPVNAVLGSPTLYTLSITNNDPHSVTFRPGLHGSLVGGDPEVAVTVGYGAPVPTAPVVVAGAGWTHVGWDWGNEERGGGPFTVTQDWVATALYGATPPSYPAWQIDLTLDGAEPTILTLGMRSDASDGWDAGVDEHCPLPAPGQACLAAADLAFSYSTDYRALAPTAEFLLVANAAAGTPVTVSWDAPDLPAGTFLSIYEVALESAAPVRTAAAWALVGNTGRNLALTSSLEVPAGETRYYVIRYGDDLAFDLALEQGWNLISLPIEPTDPAIEAVLSSGALRGGSRGSIPGHDVWQWQGQGYASATEIHACVGYWAYATETTVLLVKGTPVGQTALALHRGWNLCGTEVPRPVPRGNMIIGVIWTWDPRLLCYQPSATMLPGYGYMINASGNALVLLPEK